jgi:hypothetical protein
LDRECHRIHAAFTRACEVEGLQALVLRSEPLVYPATVLFECWIPVDGPAITERISVSVSAEVRPYFKFPIVYTVNIDNRGKRRTIIGLHSVTDDLIGGIVRWVLRRGRRPRMGKFLLRKFPLDFWKPLNKVAAVRPDYWMAIALAAWILGLFTKCSTWLVALPLTIILTRRVRSVRTAGKPDEEPRYLTPFDAWQTVIPGIGGYRDEVQKRFIEALARGAANQGFSHHVEQIWHRGLDGIDEREQIVLKFGRGIVFCQIFPYGDDLYVGWDGHLNRGQWVEKLVTQGIDRKTKRLTVVNSVVHGTQPTTEYDMVDLSCLMEWTHSQLVRLVKQQMEEHKIDQEIDFSIVRGERKGPVSEQQGQQKHRGSAADKFIKRFMRIR